MMGQGGLFQISGRRWALCPVLALIAWAGVWATFPLAAHADPSWYKKKQTIEKQKEEDAAYESAEKPVVGNPAGTQDAPNPMDSSPAAGGGANGSGASMVGTSSTPELSAVGKIPSHTVDTNLLFRREGATESLDLEMGNLHQAELNGFAQSAKYTFGWWARPNLVLGPAMRLNTLFADTYLFMMIHPGVEGRFMLSKRWGVGGFVGYGMSQGLSRVDQSHIPSPPGHEALGARHGMAAAAQLTYFFWPQRAFGIAPTLSYWYAKQDERTPTMITLGVTFQTGRPNYTGDVTAW